MKKQLYIKETVGRGRGVFCRQHIEKDEVFEICPVIVLPAADYDTIRASRLVDYVFNFKKEEKTLAISLGFGSLYNHAIHSNAAYWLDTDKQVLSYYALEDILPGTEICINYAGKPGVEFKEWFETRGIVYAD
jgi:uncharacterized protein